MGYEEFCRSSPEVLSIIGIKAEGRFLLPDLITQRKEFPLGDLITQWKVFQRKVLF